MCPGRTLNYWADENKRHLDFTQLCIKEGEGSLGNASDQQHVIF